MIPAHNALAAPVPALIVPDGAIVYTLLPFPPALVTVAVPSHPGTQLGSVLVLIAKVNNAGPVMVTEVVPTQLLASVAVIT